jgi:Uma2 family endonuclease
MTYPEYLAQEAQSQERHEFVDGDVFAMAGGTIEHGALATAFARHLGNALDGKPCRVFGSDVRVRVRKTKFSSYPDGSVVCGHRDDDPEDPNALVNPIVIVEVLSDSTEAYDRGEKFRHYRNLDSLREYVLVAQKEQVVEVRRRNASGFWELHEFVAGQQLVLDSVGVSLSVDAVYSNPLSA